MTNARILKLASIVFAGCGVLWFVYVVRGILTPFVISAVFAYVLSPYVGYLEARGFRRPVAVSALFLLFLVLFAGAIAFTVPRLVNEVAIFSKKIPEYTERIKASSATISQDIESRYPIIKEKKVLEKFSGNAEQAAERIAANLPAHLAGMASVLSLFALVPFITFFFIVEGKATIKWLFEIIPAKHTETMLSFLCEIDESLGSYIHGQFIESMCVGILSIMGLYLIGVDYAVIIGGTAGFANLIPYLGPFVGSVPAIVVGFIKYQSFGIVIKVIVVFGVVQFLDNNFIQPTIMSKGVNIHPLVVIFAVLAGAEAGGVLGMFLAVPVVCIMKIFVLAFARRLKLA